MMHSALLIRSSGMLSGISITSLTIIPQFSRRSVSFLSLAAKSGSATSASAIREEIIRLITVHLVVVFWARAIIECPQAGRNLRRNRRFCEGPGAELVPKIKTRRKRNVLPFDYTFQELLGCK